MGQARLAGSASAGRGCTAEPCSAQAALVQTAVPLPSPLPRRLTRSSSAISSACSGPLMSRTTSCGNEQAAGGGRRRVAVKGG